jgi:hypothetical protein
MRGSMGGRSFGGGHASSGFHSAPSRGFAAPSRGFASGSSRGFASGPRGFASAPRSFAPRSFAPRTFSSRPFTPVRTTAGFRTFSPAHRGFGRFPNGRFGFHRFHHRFFFHDRFFARGCFGCFSPFFFGGGFFLGDPFFGDPFYAGYPGYGYAPPPPEPIYVNSDNGSDAQLSAQVQQLTDEIDDMREEERDRDRESRAAAANTSITAKEPGVPVEFIFRDGRHISAQNYAIAGETLWILDEHAAKKFSVADLDVDTTQQANAAKGIDLHIPAAKQ